MFPPAFIRDLDPDYDDCEDYRFGLDPITTRAIHQVAKLVYKWHGKPAKETDWSEVRERLTNPLPLRLTDEEVEGIRRCLSCIEPIDLNQAIGRFGPGATAEGMAASGKWQRKGVIPDVPPSLYRCTPRDPWVPSGINPFRCTKAAEVPKSIKSNRIVSSEPAMSMYAQLAINDLLVEQIHLRFAGHVSLHDQEKHNRLLRDFGMATLDLSDASDHISSELVERVLPQLWPVLAKVRSEYVGIPTIGPCELKTFAPMGAGFCFSVMTTVILGIIAYAFTSWHYSWRRERWSVYGDDIIVPLYIAQYVMDLLERAGLVINTAKSCLALQYVESCGLELYRGFDITPVYLRDPLNTLEASKCEEIAEKLGGFMPATLDWILQHAQPVVGQRWNKRIQQSELLVRTRAERSKIRAVDGYDGLNRWYSIHSLQEMCIRGRDIRAIPTGVREEVWTKIAWRYRSAINYPNLSLWFATRGRP
jgi:hypothetical protein